MCMFLGLRSFLMGFSKIKVNGGQGTVKPKEVTIKEEVLKKIDYSSCMPNLKLFVLR